MTFLNKFWNFTYRDKLKQYYGLNSSDLTDDQAQEVYTFLSVRCKSYQGMDGDQFYHLVMLKAIDNDSIVTISLCMKTSCFVRNFETYCCKVIAKNDIRLFTLLMIEGPDINLDGLAYEIVTRGCVELLKCIFMARPYSPYTYSKALREAVRQERLEYVKPFLFVERLDIHPALLLAAQMQSLDCIKLLRFHPKMETNPRNLEVFEAALEVGHEKIAIILAKTRSFTPTTQHIVAIVEKSFVKLFRRSIYATFDNSVPVIAKSVLSSFNLEILRIFEIYCRRNGKLKELYIEICLLDCYIAMDQILSIKSFNPDDLLILCCRYCAPRCLKSVLDEQVFSKAGTDFVVREQYHHLNDIVLKILIKDKRADTSLDDNQLFIEACQNGKVSIVGMLLKDVRVNPFARNNEAIKTTIRFHHYEVLDLIVKSVSYFDNDGSCRKLCESLYDFRALDILMSAKSFSSVKSVGRKRFYSF